MLLDDLIELQIKLPLTWTPLTSTSNSHLFEYCLCLSVLESFLSGNIPSSYSSSDIMIGG